MGKSVGIKQRNQIKQQQPDKNLNVKWKLKRGGDNRINIKLKCKKEVTVKLKWIWANLWDKAKKEKEIERKKGRKEAELCCQSGILIATQVRWKEQKLTWIMKVVAKQQS